MMEQKTLQDELNLLFDKFSAKVRSVLGDNIKSVIIYGAVALTSFLKGKGEIDFICVTNENLTDDEIKKVHALHNDIRGGYLGRIGVQLEGAYYSLPMLKNPKNYIGRGYYLGASKERWKEVATAGMLSCIDIITIIRQGVVIYGEKNLSYFHEPTAIEIKEEIIKNLKHNIEWSKQMNSIWFSTEVILLTVRSMNTIETGKFPSNKEACKWFAAEHPESKWNEFVEDTLKLKYELIRSENSVINKPFIIENTTSFLYDMYGILTNKNEEQ